ncbi:tetratricopeptide repeat protein, partial [candidate division GN15 bacterium]|nr:tetratricopeptide repeat protein [candidate division GN15 bacterium]
SALITQTGRRLAEVELALDNVDEAMAFGQKALELASKIGEREEIGAAHRVIAEVFSRRQEHADAVSHGRQALEIVRSVGDPFEIGRTVLAFAGLCMAAETPEQDKVKALLDEASRTFKKLRVDYWQADADYQAGVHACRLGDLARGFRKLNRAEKLFSSLGETSRVRRVNEFLASLADQAVALSISEGNEFKVFGKLINTKEFEDLKTGQMDQILSILLERTGASRAIIVAPESPSDQLIASFQMTANQQRRFIEGFRRLLGEEIAEDRPTLRLDVRRDPYVSDLFPEIPEVVASVIVVPIVMSDKSMSFVYLDRLADDFSLNPFSQDDLNFAVGFSDIIAFKSAELQRVRLMEDNRRLQAQLQEKAAFPNIITQNKSMLELLAQVRQVVDSNISIAIEGDTGCGKDLLARAIHYNSSRRDKRFISVNCAALPETLLESELFGYRRGAFTGADRDKPGLFEEADGGTFFLDEIADMPLSIQAKILRVLEAKELVRLGESVPRKVDVRIISATNKDLKVEMEERRFRQDLYYRLSALTFRIPSLTERRDDIPLLVDHFLADSGKQMAPQTLSSLVAYDWPGNIRELENEVKKLVLLTGDREEIGPELLSSKISPSTAPISVEPAAAMPRSDDVVFDGSYSLYDYLASHEKRFIIKALRERKGVKKHAAAMLNIPESTLRLKIKEYQIDLNRLDSIN